ncbi:hypothetical protein D3C81_1390630 [compost metagenome]
MFGYIRIRLAFDGVTWASGSVTDRTSALSHKTRDYAMERESVIESGIGQFFEVRNRTRSFFGQELNFDLAAFFQYDFTFFHIRAHPSS